MNTDSLTSIPQASQDAANANPTVSGQLSALRGGGPAPVIGQGSADPTAPPVPQTQDASQISSQLSGGSTGVVFPQAPGAPTNGVSANTSVANPIPSAADIVNQGAQTTPAEATNQTLLQKVAALIGQKQGQTQLTNTAETAAGVPALADTRQSLIDQLQGLSDQSTKLQIDAGAGGSIQNQEQQDVLGRGVTAAGLAPLTAGDLRKNQIQQASIAAQSLTIKALFLGADRKYTEAKDAADKAATAQYEDQQNQIDYQNALIAANLPSMNKQEKAQADLVTQNLADRQRQLDQAKADKQTIIAAATATLAAYPNDSAAHYAAQQALTESNQQQPDLSKALGLLSKYPSLATQQAQATLASTRATTAKTLSDLNGGANSSTIQPYLKTAYDGSQYVDLSTLTPTDRAKYTQIAAQLGIKAVLTPADADKVGHIAVAKSNLNDIMNSFNSVPVTKDIPAAQGISNSISSFFGDPTIKAYQNYRTTAINTLQALAGGTGSGLRINQAEVNAAIKDIPVLVGAGADTPEQAQKKIDNLNAQLDKWQTQILGGGNTAAKDAATVHVKLSNGQTGTVNAADFDPKTMTKI